ncbi:MAG: hypothetical protein KKC25_08290 [Proteobacteria bacterium]|nr:hypothetical protein [Pseudomonadota bacterium]
MLAIETMNQEIYKAFNDELFTRLEKNTFTTEDSVRYTFFASLLKHTALATHDIVLECPHNTFDGAKIDTYLPDYDGREVIIEFKYDRAIPSGKNSPRPQKAGKHFNDINRLLSFKTSLPAMRLFIYLTDDEMASYMRNPSNNLVEIFDLKPGNQINLDQLFFNNKSATFQKEAGEAFKASIRCEWSGTLPRNHELRIFRIDK